MPAPAAARRRIDVVAAVIQQLDGSFLLAQRPAGKVYAGYWEFPGGKVEDGETPAAALSRELHEELGIDVVTAYPWIIRDFDYPHADVRLHFFRVRAWNGEPHGREAQAFAWQQLGAIDVAPVLPANGPVFAAMALPEVYGITGFPHSDPDGALARVDAALDRGLSLVQVRAKDWPQAVLERFAAAVVEHAHRRGAKVLINGVAGVAGLTGAVGVLLTAGQLLAADVGPALPLVAASCHTAADIARSEALQLDFAVLGPVCATPTHPGAVLLGWEGFRNLAAVARIPLYALGGLMPADLQRGLSCGAHGIAMVRGAWD
ncbi:MAG: Nudix family hydrolase [Burkholderiales bacterium]